MYKVTLYDRGSYPNGGQVLLDTSSQNLGVTAASYEGKLNEAGSFTFSIVARHPLYNSIESLKTYVSVEEEGLEIFWGRVILVRKMPLTGTKQVTCEGALAFLMDAELAPDSDNVTMTPEGYFRYCITQFNELISNDPARKLIVGTINVTDSAVSTSYKNGSWTEIQSVLKSKVVDLHDGLLSISRNGTEHYINWTTQIGVVNPQRIELGTNVVDQSSSESGEDIFTYVRATGADNLVYGPVLLDSEMETKYGKIIRTISFGDVSSSAELQTKTEAYISKLKDRLSLSVDINFVDMHYVDNTEVKVHLGDVFTNISGYEGTRYTAAAITRDLLNPANDKMTPKTDKDLMPSISSSGANRGSSSGGSSGGRRSLSGSSSHWYKHIHETEENLALTAKNIEITANERIGLIARQVSINADNISSVSAVANTLNTKWTEFTGTGIYQNREYINTLAGKYQIDQDGTVVLKQGTSFKIDINGSSTNVGTLLNLHDNRVNDLGQLAAAYKGSYSYQNDSEIGAIVGRYIINTNVDPTNPWVNVTPSGTTEGINPKELGWSEIINNVYTKTNDTTIVAGKQYYIPGTTTKVVYDAGSGYKIRENGVEYGVYTKTGDSTELTGGIIVDKLNDNSTTTKIKGTRVIIGENLTDDDLGTWAKNAANGTGVFAKYLTVKELTAQELNTMLANIGEATIDSLAIDEDVEVGGSITATNIYATNVLHVADGGDFSIGDHFLNVYDVQISGNTLTVYYVDGTSVPFNKAVSLRGAWNGSTYSVSATSGAISGTVPSTTVYQSITGTPNPSETVYANVYKDNPNDQANIILTNELTLEENVSAKKVSLIYSTLEKGAISTEATYNAGKSAVHLTSSWNADNDRLTIGKTTSGSIDSYSFGISAQPTITYNPTTHKYVAIAQAKVDEVVRGAASSVLSGTEAYTDGWDGCFATRRFVAPTASKQLDYGETVTVSASLKNSSGTTVSLGSRTYVAPDALWLYTGGDGSAGPLWPGTNYALRSGGASGTIHASWYIPNPWIDIVSSGTPLITLDYDTLIQAVAVDADGNIWRSPSGIWKTPAAPAAVDIDIPTNYIYTTAGYPQGTELTRLRNLVRQAIADNESVVFRVDAGGESKYYNMQF